MARELHFAPDSFFIRMGLTAALVLGVLAGALSAAFNPALAQEAEPAHFMVQGGIPGLGNAEALIYAPQILNVHRGDTVTWAINGFHNVRFPDENGLAPFVLIPGANDVEVPQVNPLVAFPTLENGAAYQGGPANSGLPAGVPGGPTDANGMFSLVIDLEPGSYNYLCDVHPGMAGVINVVDAGTAVPSPIEAAMAGKQEADAALALASEAVQAEVEAAAGINVAGDDGVAHVQTGSTGTGRTTVNRYVGFTTIIQAGQTVTWTLPQDSPDPHTITWPPLRGQDIAPVPQDAGPPILSFGPGFTPNLPENGEMGADGTFNSGLLLPGQSVSLTFTEPGVFPYVCNIHPGMDGVVVVQPA
jgi:plastocyanin